MARPGPRRPRTPRARRRASYDQPRSVEAQRMDGQLEDERGMRVDAQLGTTPIELIGQLLELVQVVIDLAICPLHGELDTVAIHAAGLADPMPCHGRHRQSLEVDQSKLAVALEELLEHRAHAIRRRKTALLLDDAAIQALQLLQ